MSMRVVRLWKIALVLILMSVLLFSSHAWNHTRTASAEEAHPVALPETPEPISHHKQEPAAHIQDFSLPILGYHKVCATETTATCVNKAHFQEQLRHLHDAGYRTISFEDLLRWEMGIGFLPQKPVILTFDDGYLDNYTTMLPMVRERRMKATVFLVTRLMGTQGYLTWHQVKTMQNSGIEFGAHTLNHPNLTKLKSDKKRQEIVKSKHEVEAQTGRPALAFSYPYGFYDQEAEKMVREAGFVYAVSGQSGWAEPDKGPLHMKRVVISGFTTLEAFKKKLP
jgi:peptidoglycan/xylan/chitin deacetylase (PgdA/CDA1 family)